MKRPELEGPTADGMWANEFGLRGLIYYWKIGAVGICLAGMRARWELEDVRKGNSGFSKEGE